MDDDLLTGLPGDLPGFLARFTHHGAVSARHLPASLDEFVFRFHRRTATNLSHRFPHVIQPAVRTRPATYHAIVAATAS